MNEARVMEVLRQVEWVKLGDFKAFCPYCERNEYEGHADNCKLDGLLRYIVGYRPRVKVMNMLRELEWSGAYRLCPSCSRPEVRGHRADCRLDALLREANEDIAVKGRPVASATIADGVRGPSITAGAVMAASLLAVFNLLGIPEGGKLDVWDTIDPDRRFAIRRVRRTQGKAGEDDGTQQ